jgi:selenocysteine-specific elongation factor
MRHIIAGTAGHIDHGKTALVRALTGIDTDRLEEEKRRGISIDIGFAHLDLSSGIHIGLVDVPGHERFIKNMLAGVGGIDFLLLVIAADESIKPQTREHFEICRLLGIRRGIVVLTKADLVDPDLIDLVRLETEEFVSGSFLDGAPVVAVSSVTGQGLPELKDRMAEVAAAVQPKDSATWFRLPVDRSFSLRGFGTVVTGTLISGSVAPEQEVELYPGGSRLRVRTVQVHGSPAPKASAGQRTALNLAGIEPSAVPRGVTLSEPGRFAAVAAIDSRFELLASAKPLRHRAPVHFHSGTAEIEAHAYILGDRAELQPGAVGYVRFLLRQPALLLPGDRFIVRMFSPVVTIGGGTVLDIDAPRKRRRDAPLRLQALEGATLSARIGLLAREASFGIAIETAVARTGARPEAIASAAQPGSTVRLLAQPRPWLIDAARFAALAAALETALAEFHRQNPLLAGMSKEELRSRELSGAPPFLIDALLAASPTLAADAETLRLRAHKPVLKQDESAATARIETLFRAAGLAVPSVAEVLTSSGVEPARARTLLQILLRDRTLIRLSDDLVFHSESIAGLRQMLSPRKGQLFGVAEFKEWTAVSRKYAIPLLEYLDRERITRREGDRRRVL